MSLVSTTLPYGEILAGIWRDISWHREKYVLSSVSWMSTVVGDAELRFAHKGVLLPGPFKFWLKSHPLMEN